MLQNTTQVNNSNQYSINNYWDGSCLLKYINDTNYNLWFRSVIEAQKFVDKILLENAPI